MINVGVSPSRSGATYLLVILAGYGNIGCSYVCSRYVVMDGGSPLTWNRWRSFYLNRLWTRKCITVKRPYSHLMPRPISFPKQDFCHYTGMYQHHFSFYSY